MQAETRSFTFLQNVPAPICIPFFQRSYVWNEQNWQDLLWDLEKNNELYYLGSIVIKTINKNSKDSYTLLIDGQQRLTTLSILLRVLYDNIDINNEDILYHVFNVCLFYQDKHIYNKKVVRLQQSKIDRNYFEEIISTGVHTNIQQNNTSNIIQCYKFFTSAIQQMDLEKRRYIFENILSSNNKCFIIIELDEYEDEQKIFDSINATGMHLSSADIIKNSFFQHLFDVYAKTFSTYTINDQENYVQEIYKNNWESIFLNNQENRDFWLKGRRIGHLTRDNIEILFHAVALIKGIYHPHEHKFENLSFIYKYYFIHKCNTLEQMENFIQDVKYYAILYKEKICQINQDTILEFDDFEKRLLYIIDITNIRSFYAYILYVYKNFQHDNDKLKFIFQKLEQYLIYYFFCKLLHKRNNNNSLCKILIDDLKNNNSCSKLDQVLHNIDNQYLKTALKNIQMVRDTPKSIKLILFFIELYRRKQAGYYGISKLQYSNYTLEHIMPQKWEEYWDDVEVVDENNEVMTDRQLATEYRNKMINNLGNFTLLSKNFNSTLQNRSFKDKICGLPAGNSKKKRIPGIKDYAELDITKQDIVIPFEKGETVWNEKRIRERCDKLIEDALAIWS